MKNILLIVVFLIGFSGFSQKEEAIHQPYGSFWFVEDLLQWSPETDPHAKFNVSYVPLADRFIDTTTQIRKELSNDPKIMALVASHPTSNHPSQGFNTIKQYTLPFWQYLDYFIQWGGSAREGIILTPVPTWTDAAHRNGVKVFGTVFFPPEVYGGKKEWVVEFLQKDDNGNFPVADKLVEVAKYYRFDGWFINQETDDMGEQIAQDMIDFIEYYQRISGENIELIWYDAMITDGRVIWQQELNDHNLPYFQKGDKEMADYLFIDFKYQPTNLEDSHVLAHEIGRSPWELFAGIDVQQRSYKSFARWSSLYKNEQPYTTSIGLYWPNSTFDISETKEPEDVYKNEQQFWHGGTTFKTPFGEMKWKGFTNYFPAAGIVKSLPFVTNFNYGLGRFYNEQGKQLSDKEWHNLCIQDILPTWQWQVDTTQVNVNYNFKDSYTGGNCLEIQSISEGKIPLYKTNISLDKLVRFTVVAKGDVSVKTLAYVLLSDGSKYKFPITINSNWAASKFKIPTKKNIKIVTVGFETAGEGAIQIGEISMTYKKGKIKSKPDFTVEAFPKSDTVELYIHIASDSQAVYNNIYVLTSEGKVWLGKTTSTDYYIAGVPVQNGYVSIVVEGVAKDGSKGKQQIKRIKI